MFENYDIIVKKFGKNCKLNKDNIKDVYFTLYCNNLGYDPKITKFLTSHYSREEILSWNNEYICNNIAECRKLLKNDEWSTIKTIGKKIVNLCSVFTYEQQIYEYIIDLLDDFYGKYGYFMNFSFIKSTPDYPGEDRTFYNFLDIYIAETSLENKEFIAKSTGCEYAYLPDDGYRGLIPRLRKLACFQTLNRLFVEIIAQIFIHFNETSEIMNKNNIIPLHLSDKLEDYILYNSVRDYAVRYCIQLPSELNKFYE